MNPLVHLSIDIALTEQVGTKSFLLYLGILFSCRVKGTRDREEKGTGAEMDCE